MLLTTNYCLWIAASAAPELAPIANSTSGIQSRAVASVKTDANRFARNVAPIIREIQPSGVASHRGIARSLNARGVTTALDGGSSGLDLAPFASLMKSRLCDHQESSKAQWRATLYYG